MTFVLTVGQKIWFISDDMPGVRTVECGRIINFDAETVCYHRDGIGVEFKSLGLIFLKEEFAKRNLPK
jgi:hypothetical protein